MRDSFRRVSAVASLSVLELYRRRDLFAVLLLTVVIVTPLAAFNFMGMQGIVRYIKEITLLLIWLFSLAIGVGVAARQFPAELDSRTIYPLLAKPLSRREVLLGKFFGAWLATGTAILLFYLLFLMISGLKEGQWGSVLLLQAVLFHLLFAAVFTALVILGSLLLTPSANLTICTLLAVGMLLFGVHLPELAVRQVPPLNGVLWCVHALSPHLEFFDLRQRVIHGLAPLSGGVVLGVVAYAVCYTAALLAVADRVFRRKRL